MEDTIFALASAQGKAGVAVIRLSGPRAHEAVRRLAGPVPEPRRAALRLLRDGEGERIDQALILTFALGASFTGEAVAELQVHGSPAVVAGVLEQLAFQPGLRLAEPGEFARRALLNGRMSLAEVEGLGDLIEAETREQQRQANRLLSGQLGQLAERWRAVLIEASALLAAGIDFADEDLQETVMDEAASLLSEVRRDLAREIEGSLVAERLRHGFEVAIVGPPNAGKSTLLNHLARRPAALTSEVAGTTRDVIEVRMDLGGLPVTLLDTAGLRHTRDPLEAMGVKLAEDRARQADLRIFLRDDGFAVPDWAQKDDIVVWAKADLRARPDAVSGLTGAGVEDVTWRVQSAIRSRLQSGSVAVNLRHRRSLREAVASLDRARSELASGAVDLAAEEVRLAVRSLDRLVGAVDVEDVLDQVFASFCLGK